MTLVRRRVWITLAILAVTAVLSSIGFYRNRMERGSLKAAQLPLTVGSWSGADVPVEEYIKQILETDDVIQRNFSSPQWKNIPVQLAVVFSSDNRRVAHPPEVCYLGSGWELTAKTTVRPTSIPPMIRLLMINGRRRDLVLYCYKAGDRLTASYFSQQMNIIVNQLLLRATSSALIRFSTPMLDTETIDAAQARVVDLAAQMIPEIQKTLSH